MNKTYFFKFEGTTLYYRQLSNGWVAYLPHSGASKSQLLLTLSRTIANWYDADRPPSGYPKGALDELEREPSEEVLLRHPLEICDLYERSAVARLLNVANPDQVLYLVQRSILVPEAADSFRECRDFYSSLAEMLLAEVAMQLPELSTSERIETTARAMAERFVECHALASMELDREILTRTSYAN